MAKIRLLVDTDILIDYLKKIKPAKALFDSGITDIYCSILSKKELLTKPGLSSSERKKIINLLNQPHRSKLSRYEMDVIISQQAAEN